MKDLVITGGVNVSPTEVEAVLARHPDVHDVCVVGVPDDEWGELVVAFVVPRPSARPDSAPSCARSDASGSAGPSCRARRAPSTRSPTASGKPLAPPAPRAATGDAAGT